MKTFKRWGSMPLETEREFNQRAGVSEEFFDVPEFMREEPLPPRNSVFDIPLEEMKTDLDSQDSKGCFLRKIADMNHVSPQEEIRSKRVMSKRLK